VTAGALMVGDQVSLLDLDTRRRIASSQETPYVVEIPWMFII